jgi:hypothetical protein
MKMVRLACLFSAVLVLSQQAAFAQDTPAFGVMGGVNFSYFATSPENETHKEAGALVGVFGVFRRDKVLKIQPEVQFSQRNVDVLFGGTVTPFRTNYLNLGMMTRIKLYKGLYTSQGVQFSFPMSSNITVAGTEVDIKDNVSWDFSIPAGIGHQFGRVGIEGRWDAGLKRVEKAPLGNFIKRNRAISIFAIVGF